VRDDDVAGCRPTQTPGHRGRAERGPAVGIEAEAGDAQAQAGDRLPALTVVGRAGPAVPAGLRAGGPREGLRAAFDSHLGRHIVTAEGEVIDFGERDALHYVVYSLLPLAELCLAARAHGEDWLWRPNALGASVATAIDWLVPYAEGRRSHQEFVRSKIRFDAERARAGIAHFGGVWDRTRALELFALATALDRRWEPTLASIARAAGRQPSERVRLLYL